MRKLNLYFVLLSVCMVLLGTSSFAIDAKKERFVLKASISGLIHHRPFLNYELPEELSIRNFGYGSNLQFGMVTRKQERTEYRHYIELNHLHYTADVKYLGYYKADMLFLSISPLQYHVQLNPEALNVIDMEVGLTFGFNLSSVYHYNFLNNERKSVKKSQDISIGGINLSFSTERMFFNKKAEIGLKARISPVIGVVVVDHSYSGLELFYGIKF